MALFLSSAQFPCIPILSSLFRDERVLLAKEGEIDVERTSTSNLKRELSRVRRDFIVSTSNRSEQHSALLGGRKKENRSANTWTRGKEQGLSRVEQSALQGSREMVSWDDFFMTKVQPKVEATPSLSGDDLNGRGAKQNFRPPGTRIARLVK